MFVDHFTYNTSFFFFYVPYLFNLDRSFIIIIIIYRFSLGKYGTYIIKKKKKESVYCRIFWM